MSACTWRPRLSERLVFDAASEPGVLPLLQETMVLIWERRKQRLLPLSSYSDLSRGGLSGLAVAMVSRADGTLASLTPPQRISGSTHLLTASALWRRATGHSPAAAQYLLFGVQPPTATQTSLSLH